MLPQFDDLGLKERGRKLRFQFFPIEHGNHLRSRLPSLPRVPK